MSFFLTPLIAYGLGAVGAGAIGGGALIITPGLAVTLTTGTVALAGSIASTVLTIGASIGLNAALGLLNRKSNTQQNQITIKQALPARFVDFGRVKTGGAIMFYYSPNTNLYSVRVLSCTKIQEIETLYLDDYATDGDPLNSGTPFTGVSGPWLGQVIIQARLGSDDQTALDAITPAGAWTSDHRLRGMAAVGVVYIQGKKEDFQKKFPNGPPNATAVIKGAMVPDPRDPGHDLTDDDTWTYSDNAARAFMRWALDRDGWGLSPDDLALSTWEQSCDDSDDAVETIGGTEPRYRAWGRYSTSEARATTLRSFLACMGGTLLEQPDGKLALFVGKHRDPNPETDITDAHILDINLDRFPDALDRVDAIKPRITSEGAGWEEQECPAFYSGEPFYGAAPDIDDLPLAYCPATGQGQRIAKATLRQKRAGWSGTVKTTLHGLRCYGEPVVRLSNFELGIDGEIFEITSPPALDTSDMTVTLGIRSYASDTWTMDADEMGEMGDVQSTSQDFLAPAPEGLEATPAGLTVGVTWELVDDEDAYTNEAYWRPHDPDPDSETGWVAVTSVSSGAASFTVSGAGDYDFRVSRVTARGFVSDWAVLPEIEVT